MGQSLLPSGPRSIRSTLSAALLQGEVVAEGLGGDHPAEGRVGLGDGDILEGRVDQLEEDPAVRTALVQLAGRMEKTGPVAGGGGVADPVPDLVPNRARAWSRRVVGQIGLDGEVVVVAHGDQQVVEAIGEIGSEEVDQVDPGGFGIQGLPRPLFGQFDIGLVEGMNSQDGSCRSVAISAAIISAPRA